MESGITGLSEHGADLSTVSQLKVTYEAGLAHLRLALFNCGEWALGGLGQKHVTSAHCRVKGFICHFSLWGTRANPIGHWVRTTTTSDR